MNKIHKLMGESFHGWYEVNLKGPAEGFLLSPGQTAKLARARCGRHGCTCGGHSTQVKNNGRSWVEYSEVNGALRLIPGRQEQP